MAKGRRFPLLEARLRKGLKQTDMGKVLGISGSSYGAYETGAREPDFGTCVAIGRILDQPTEVLFTDLIDSETIKGQTPMTESEIVHALKITALNLEHAIDLRDRGFPVADDYIKESIHRFLYLLAEWKRISGRSA